MRQINQQKLVEYWTEASNDDLQSAKDIITNTKSYIQGLFFLHLSLEKLIKALFVQTHLDHAPLTHNLLGLVSKCGLELTDKSYESTLVEINQYNIEMRYPDDIKTLKKKVSQEYACQMLVEGELVYQWILEKLKSKPSL